ncbi:hypothetical protein [Arthrobacter sp. KK5.5]|uniref:hypothetical protein n=1 Tax=Arthrobacter sp. KK5.5 TaxID=3373084 RepID=UPI003EE7E8ED
MRNDLATAVADHTESQVVPALVRAAERTVSDADTVYAVTEATGSTGRVLLVATRTGLHLVHADGRCTRWPAGSFTTETIAGNRARIIEGPTAKASTADAPAVELTVSPSGWGRLLDALEQAGSGEPPPEGAPPAEDSAVSTVRTVLGLALAGMVVFVGFMVFGGSSAPAEPRLNDRAAVRACETAIKERLVAPSGATYDSEPRLSGEDIIVGTTVDSQNGFGATLRSEWLCRTVGAGDDWTPVEVFQKN